MLIQDTQESETYRGSWGDPVILLCFSVDSRISLENIEKKWINCIKDVYAYRNSPKILVATKNDLKNNVSINTITDSEVSYKVYRICKLQYPNTRNTFVTI